MEDRSGEHPFAAMVGLPSVFRGRPAGKERPGEKHGLAFASLCSAPLEQPILETQTTIDHKAIYSSAVGKTPGARLIRREPP